MSLSAHPLPRAGFVDMEVCGERFRGKENAGAALLDAVKEATAAEPVRIGAYRGFLHREQNCQFSQDSPFHPAKSVIYFIYRRFRAAISEGMGFPNIFAYGGHVILRVRILLGKEDSIRSRFLTMPRTTCQ